MTRLSLLDPSVIGEHLEAIIIFWRVLLPTVLGVFAGLAVFYLGDRDPASAAVAFVVWVGSLIAGLVWQFAKGRSQ
jgi:hypothetical protein